jgi:biopolymer transport protein ExbD
MSMSVGPGDGGEEEEVMSTINTTPLVDVMLVMLIIFLITIPTIIQTVPLELPKERNVPTQTKPGNVLISINRDGEVFWGQEHMVDNEQLVERMKKVAVMQPQPEVHIRGDYEARYQAVGRVVFGAQRAGIRKLGFITEPPPNSGG